MLSFVPVASDYDSASQLSRNPVRCVSAGFSLMFGLLFCPVSMGNGCFFSRLGEGWCRDCKWSSYLVCAKCRSSPRPSTLAMLSSKTLRRSFVRSRAGGAENMMLVVRMVINQTASCVNDRSVLCASPLQRQVRIRMRSVSPSPSPTRNFLQTGVFAGIDAGVKQIRDMFP